MIDPTIIDGYAAAMTPEIRKYLNDRHISDDVIHALKLGWAEINGNWWIAFPIFDSSGAVPFIKLKRPPNGKADQPKAMCHPAGEEATLYPLPYLVNGLEQVVICEGEPDCCALMTHGIEAVTSTAGAGTFKEEWLDFFPQGIKIILCFDLDEAGQEGEKKVKHLFETKRPDVRIGTIRFPEALKKWGKDATDYFLNPLLWPAPDCPNPVCVAEAPLPVVA